MTETFIFTDLKVMVMILQYGVHSRCLQIEPLLFEIDHSPEREEMALGAQLRVLESHDEVVQTEALQRFPSILDLEGEIPDLVLEVPHEVILRPKVNLDRGCVAGVPPESLVAFRSVEESNFTSWETQQSRRLDPFRPECPCQNRI